MRRLLLLLVLFVIAGCSSASSGSSASNPDVVMAPETKVLDDAARASVASFDPKSGAITLHRSPFSDALQVKDILASKTNPPAAPQGFLRRVTAIDRSGGDVVVQTTQAGLAEALKVAHVRETGRIAAADPSQVGPLPPGLSLVSTSAAKPGQVHTSTIPAGHGTHIHFDHYQLQVNAGPVTGDINLDGDLTYDGGFSFNLDLDLLGVHHFLAEAELDVDTSLTVGGMIQVGFDVQSPPIAENLAAIDIQIGPFPLVLVPQIAMRIGVQGNIGLSVTFHETSSDTVTVGTRYDDGVGWQDLTGSRGDGSIDQAPQFSFSVDLEAYARVEASILAYGVVGPYFFAQEGFEINATVPRRPFLEAGIHMQYGAGVKATLFGIIDLADYSFTALDLFLPIYQSPDIAPFVTITTPIDDSSHYLGHDRIRFEAGVLDLQEGTDDEDRVRVTWTEDGQLVGRGATTANTLPNASPGPHTITVTVTDSLGLSATATRVVTIDQVAAHAFIDAPVPGTTVTAGATYDFLAHVDDANVPSSNVCIVQGYQVTWSTDGPSDAVADPHACPSASIVFHGAAGPRTVTMTAQGPYGETSTATLALNVVLPAPGVLTFMDPAENAEIDATNGSLSTPIHFDLSNAPAGAATYTWSATSYNAAGAVFHTGTLGTTSTAAFDWANPNGDGFIDLNTAQMGRSPPQHSGQHIVVHVHAVDGGGQVYDGDVDIWFVWVPG